MPLKPVYLDWNASAPVRPEVVAAVAEAMSAGGNPSSVHGYGRAARRSTEVARARVAALVGAEPTEVVFTSGGSEANSLALRGVIAAALSAGQRFTRLFVSSIEHDSVAETAASLAESVPGLRVVAIPVTSAGIVDLYAMRTLMMEGKGRTLVSVMLANNETGALQPVAEIARLAAEYGAIVHTDAAQAAGRIDVEMSRLGVHMMTLSAHKLGGAQGVGALIVRGDVAIERQIAGGGQELGRRAGTENVVGIVGFGVAAKLALETRDAWKTVAALRDRLETEAASRVPNAIIHARDTERLPNTTCIGVPGLAAETQVIALDLAGVAVSAGAACSSGKVRPSRVLQAMGVSDDDAGSAIRVSLGPTTTDVDIDTFLNAWTDHVKRATRVRHVRLAAG